MARQSSAPQPESQSKVTTDTPAMEKESEHKDAPGMDGHGEEAIGTAEAVIDLTSQSEVAIDIQNFAYSKPNIKIKKGTKVTWTNQDTVKHNAMKAHEGDEGVHHALTEDQVKPDVFSGPMLAKGETYSFVFNTVEVAPYHCAPHPKMQGTVTVVE